MTGDDSRQIRRQASRLSSSAGVLVEHRRNDADNRLNVVRTFLERLTGDELQQLEAVARAAVRAVEGAAPVLVIEPETITPTRPGRRCACR